MRFQVGFLMSIFDAVLVSIMKCYQHVRSLAYEEEPDYGSMLKWVA